MKQILAATLLVLTTPAAALDYSCSPYGAGCVPLSSQPSYVDGGYGSPSVIVSSPIGTWPRRRLIDGHGAQSRREKRERVR